MKKVKIVVSVGYYPPDHTGAGLRLHRMYRRMAELLPIAVTVLARSGRGQCQGWHCYEGVRVYRTPVIKGKLQAFSEVSKFFLTNSTSNFDVLHASGSFRTVVSSCIWARLLGIPIIRESAMSGTVAQNSGLKDYALRWSFTSGNIAVARTTEEEKMLRSIDIPLNRIYSASYPVDDHAFGIPTQAQREKARRSFNLPKKAKVHLIIGKLGPRKNQRFGLLTLSKLPANHYLILVGPPDGVYPQRLKKEAWELGVANRLKIIDKHVSDIAPYYWASDTLWVPSLREGVPNVMKEALICGLPVIMNQALGLQDQVSEKEGVFNVPLNTTAFVQMVNTVIDRFDIPNAQISAIAQKRFGISVWGDEFAAIISRLVS